MSIHYYVDGYNLLFKTAWAHSQGSFEKARQKLIEELDLIAGSLKLNITLVFDAPFQSDELKRGHFHSLEIIFTAKGQTADDLLELLVQDTDRSVVVVTSDRSLANKIRSSGASVEGVETFIASLRKRSRKKQPIQKTQIPKPKPPPEEVKAKKPIDMKNLPPLSDLDAWEQIFTSYHDPNS